jgi:hypothetical protein
LAEPRRFIQVVAGARQVGKTTLVGQVLARLATPATFASGDESPWRCLKAQPAAVLQDWA